MIPSRIYVLDSNVFIDAARRYYAFDIAPPFWSILLNHAKDGHLQSIDRVKVELELGKDELARWASGSFHGQFASTEDDDGIAAYRKIMIWSQAQTQYTDAAKAEFAAVADGWLVAYAMAKVYVIVTLEQFDPNIKRRIKIPKCVRSIWC